jgi:hypothetical protein
MLLQSTSTKLNIKITRTEEETLKYFEAVGEKFYDITPDGI